MPDGNDVKALAGASVVQAATSPLNLHQRLHAVMMDVSYVQKDRKVGTYMVVSHDMVTAKVRPALVKHRVAYYPQSMEYVQNGNRTEMKVDIHFVNIDDRNDFIAVPSLGYGIDASDKGPGKALSYAVKMALLKALGLETGEDADDGTDQQHVAGKPSDGLGEPAKKSPPGISAVKTENRAQIRDLHGCEDAESLIALINTDTFKRFAWKVCKDFPSEWLGPEDNSGLSGSLAQRATELGCVDDITAWIRRMENARTQATQQAAE